MKGVLALALAGCYAPAHTPCALLCAESGECPEGTTCVDRWCKAPGDPVCASELIAMTTFGSAAPDLGADLARGADGTVFVTGSHLETMSVGSSTRSASADRTDAFVATLGADLAPVSGVGFGGDGDDAGRAIAVFEDGDLLVAGVFHEAIDFCGTVLTATAEAGFVARLGDGGTTCRWAHALGVDVRDVAIDRGDVYLAGAFRDDLIDPGTGAALATAVGGSDGFVARLAGTGAVAWAAAFGTSGDLESVDGVTVAEGVVGLAGTRGAEGSHDVFAARLAAETGEPISDLSFRTPQDDFAADVCAIADELRVVGRSGDPPDILLAREAGTRTDWKIGGAAADLGAGLACAPDGSYLVAAQVGPMVDFGCRFPEGAAGENLAVARFAADDTCVWARSLGGTGAGATSVIVESSGTVLVTGRSMDDVTVLRLGAPP